MATSGGCKLNKESSFGLQGPGGPFGGNYSNLPRLSFGKGAASSGEGQYGYTIGAKDASGKSSGVSEGSYFRVNQGGQDYIARMAVPPYSTLDRISRPEDRWYSVRSTRTVEERSQKAQLTMIPVDKSGNPIDGAQFRTGTVDAFSGGITSMKTTGEVYAANARATNAVTNDAQQLIQQGRNQAAVATKDMGTAETRYQDMTTATGLAKRVGGEFIGAAGDKYYSAATGPGQAMRGQAANIGRWATNATGGRIAATTAAEYSANVMQNLATNTSNTALGATVDTISGNGPSGGQIFQQSANGLLQSMIPGNNFINASGNRGVLVDASKVAADQMVNAGSNSISGSSNSWSQTGISTTGSVANSVIDNTIGKTGVPGRIIAAGAKYNVDQLTNIAEFNNARAGFEQSNATFSRASNIFMNKMATDPTTHQSSQNAFSRDLQSSGFSTPGAPPAPVNAKPPSSSAPPIQPSSTSPMAPTSGFD